MFQVARLCPEYGNSYCNFGLSHNPNHNPNYKLTIRLNTIHIWSIHAHVSTVCSASSNVFTHSAFVVAMFWLAATSDLISYKNANSTKELKAFCTLRSTLWQPYSWFCSSAHAQLAQQQILNFLLVLKYKVQNRAGSISHLPNFIVTHISDCKILTILIFLLQCSLGYSYFEKCPTFFAQHWIPNAISSIIHAVALSSFSNGLLCLPSSHYVLCSQWCQSVKFNFWFGLVET